MAPGAVTSSAYRRRYERSGGQERGAHMTEEVTNRQDLARWYPACVRLVVAAVREIIKCVEFANSRKISNATVLSQQSGGLRRAWANSKVQKYIALLPQSERCRYRTKADKSLQQRFHFRAIPILECVRRCCGRRYVALLPESDCFRYQPRAKKSSRQKFYFRVVLIPEYRVRCCDRASLKSGDRSVLLASSS